MNMFILYLLGQCNMNMFILYVSIYSDIKLWKHWGLTDEAKRIQLDISRFKKNQSGCVDRSRKYERKTGLYCCTCPRPLAIIDYRIARINYLSK